MFAANVVPAIAQENATPWTAAAKSSSPVDTAVQFTPASVSTRVITDRHVLFSSRINTEALSFGEWELAVPGGSPKLAVNRNVLPVPGSLSTEIPPDMS